MRCAEPNRPESVLGLAFTSPGLFLFNIFLSAILWVSKSY
jgi:hypothetical protein